MRHNVIRRLSRFVACLVVLEGCAAGGGNSGGGDEPGASPDASTGLGPTSDAATCEPPDMLIVLDRTMSMHFTPENTKPENSPTGRLASKWAIAVAAVEQLAATFDGTIRFGLELFPRDPGGGACVTLAQRIAGLTSTNPMCEEGEIAVTPALAAGASVAGAIDVETTGLCSSTPIGAGLSTARAALQAAAHPGREAYALLITDGKDSCDPALALAQTQALAASGVRTFVVGFGAAGANDGVEPAQLNDLACAGRTAAGFPAPCTASATGDYRATAPNGPPLYLRADDAAALAAALSSTAGDVCCGCVL